MKLTTLRVSTQKPQVDRKKLKSDLEYLKDIILQCSADGMFNRYSPMGEMREWEIVKDALRLLDELEPQV